eukprot:6491070-Amphidinium_carterae.1
MAFQGRKQRQRKIEQHLQGTLLAHEAGDIIADVPGYVQDQQRTRWKAQLGKDRKKAIDLLSSNLYLQRTSRMWEVIHNIKTCSIAKDVPVTLHSRLLQSMGSRGLQHSDDITKAKVFVVQDVSKPPQKIAWALALYGGVAVSPTFMLNSNGKGAAVEYKRSLLQSLQVWLSPQFCSSAPRIAAFIREGAESADSHWRLLQSIAAFRAARDHKRKCWAVVPTKCQAEKKRRLSAEQLLTKITSVDRSSIVYGVCRT